MKENKLEKQIILKSFSVFDVPFLFKLKRESEGYSRKRDFKQIIKDLNSIIKIITIKEKISFVDNEYLISKVGAIIEYDNEIGISILREYRKQGIAYNSLIKYLTKKVKIKADNIHSLKLFRKLGFKESNRKKEFIFMSNRGDMQKPNEVRR